jgi:hypothetical protein
MNRLQELQQAAADRALATAVVHTDRMGSLASNRKRLPALSALVAALEHGTVDTVLVSTYGVEGGEAIIRTGAADRTCRHVIRHAANMRKHGHFACLSQCDGASV